MGSFYCAFGADVSGFERRSATAKRARHVIGGETMPVPRDLKWKMRHQGPRGLTARMAVTGRRSGEVLQAATDGPGVADIACLPEAALHLKSGHLVRMLVDGTVPLPGLRLWCEPGAARSGGSSRARSSIACFPYGAASRAKRNQRSGAHAPPSNPATWMGSRIAL